MLGFIGYIIRSMWVLKLIFHQHMNEIPKNKKIKKTKDNEKQISTTSIKHATPAKVSLITGEQKIKQAIVCTKNEPNLSMRYNWSQPSKIKIQKGLQVTFKSKPDKVCCSNNFLQNIYTQQSSNRSGSITQHGHTKHNQVQPTESPWTFPTFIHHSQRMKGVAIEGNHSKGMMIKTEEQK